MWQEFFSQAYKLPLLVLKRAMANPMGIFIYGILSKWYILVMIAVISVTFWVFKGLEEAGVIDAVTKELNYGFREAQAVAQNCTRHIVDLPKMWNCIQNTTGNDYKPNDDERVLRNTLQRDSDNGEGTPFQQHIHNPYDTPQPNGAMEPADTGITPSATDDDGVNRL